MDWGWLNSVTTGNVVAIVGVLVAIVIGIWFSKRNKTIIQNPKKGPANYHNGNGDIKTNDIYINNQTIISNNASSEARKQSEQSSPELTDSIPLIPQTCKLGFGLSNLIPALKFKDGIQAFAEVRIDWKVINPYKFHLFANNNHPMDALVDLTQIELRLELETLSFEQAHTNRRRLSTQVAEKMRPEFDKRGISLESVSIGALDQIVKSHKDRF